MVQNLQSSELCMSEQKVLNIIIVEDFKLTRVGLRCALNENPDMEVVAKVKMLLKALNLLKNTNPMLF